MTISSPRAVKRILKWGGIPVLAHPEKMKVSNIYDTDRTELKKEKENENNDFRNIMLSKLSGDNLFKAGLKGIEVFHPSCVEAKYEYYKNIALKNNLIITGGSDLHKLKDCDYKLGRFGISIDDYNKMKRDKNEK